MKQSDLHPPLGSPGGVCFTVDRAKNNLKDRTLKEVVPNKIQRGIAISNAEAHKVYPIDVEPGVGAYFDKILITSHAQFRMDQRSVTVRDVQASLTSFLKTMDVWKRNDPNKWKRYSESLLREEHLDWLDARTGLKLAFVLEDMSTVRVLTVFWKGVQDPEPSVCNITASASTSGEPLLKPYTQNIPTPSYSQPDGGDTSDFDYRTKSKEFDTFPQLNNPYGAFERRVVVAVARQHIQRGRVKLYDQMQYRQNKNQKKHDQKVRYERNKNKADFKRKRHLRKTHPERYKRLPGSPSPSIADRSKEQRVTQKVAEFWVNKYTNPEVHTINRGESKEEIMSKLANNTVQQVLADTAMAIQSSSLNVRPSSTSYDVDQDVWTFRIKGSVNDVYTVRVQMNDGALKAHCDCPFWIWSGPAHWAQVYGYALEETNQPVQAPAIRDPKGQNLVCKHVLACIRRIEQDN